MLRNAASGALVLMDEMGSGTDPAQGVAIAQVGYLCIHGYGCIHHGRNTESGSTRLPHNADLNTSTTQHATKALLEALLETGARVAITTHYLQLKELAQVDDRFTVGAMEVGAPPVGWVGLTG